FNVNTDISTVHFSSEKDGLKVIFGSEDDLVGFVAFSGTLGKGKVKVTMANGVVIEGVITGGPKTVQSIVGVGTWTRS
ncbi:hypothetical protein GALMADRAFT_28074, partial [Galerina marginata CBS 339.88]